ncbi:hypothetical protein [Thiolinea disciformis]|uniref:hypothetical protein n=1 Tax=Thiolinea disciformis TaxID=125614 RepID=UPI00036D18A7|nr:hypothetical protein [Thiolinea disciformis]
MKTFTSKRLMLGALFSVSLMASLAMPQVYADTAPAKLKSIPVSPNEFMALAIAVENVEKAKNQTERNLALQKLRDQSKAVDASAARFAASLRANKEESLFNDFILQKAMREEGAQFVAAIKAAHPSGLPSAMVAQPNFAQNQILNFEKKLSPLSKFDWWQLIGISPVEAGLRGTGCSVAVYVLSRGEGTDVNYKLCSRWW